MLTILITIVIFTSQTNKKRINSQIECAFVTNEVIMKQNPIQSQTASFSKAPSQTTAILYQEPNADNTISPASNFFSNLCMSLLLVVIVFSMTLMGLKSCADDAGYQSSASSEQIDKKMGASK